MLDLGELRGWDYYSGIHLEGYAEGFGAELVSGGRYDHLLERFGPPGPATGFAFDVNRLLLAQEAQGVEPALPAPRSSSSTSRRTRRPRWRSPAGSATTGSPCAGTS